MGDIFGSGAMTITGLWLLYFYIEVAGLSPAAAASILRSPKFGMASPTRSWVISPTIFARAGATPNILYYRRAALLLLCPDVGKRFWLCTVSWYLFVIQHRFYPLDGALRYAACGDDLALRSAFKMSGARMLFARATAFLSALIL